MHTKPASARIVESLREEILDGALAPGMQIRQELVAEQFGVSRVPVREALRQLEAEGLIQSELHRGAFVATRSLDEVIEMLDIRIGLEVRALKLALVHIDRETLLEAEGILDRYDKSATPQEWRDLNLAFHLCLYRRSNRPRLVKMIEDLMLGTDRFLRAYISATVGREGPQGDHRQLLALCAGRSKAAALRLLEAHIETTKAALRRAHALGPGRTLEPKFRSAVLHRGDLASAPRRT
jgi:DNA-binding GntR family transcriptional regulator